MKTKKKTPKTPRGGRRPGAGRPPAHKVQLLVRLNPATAKKIRMLAGEVEIGIIMTPEAFSHLSAADAVMCGILRDIGPCILVPELRRSPFQSLVQAVAHQQLNGTAANTILTRFTKLFPGRRFPRPGDLASVADEDLRQAGFSRAKVASIRDIAAKTLDGTIPTSKKIPCLTDEEIIARLIEVRGVGRWTVEMLLIFQLGRMDVLPADDFGVRHGFRVAYGRDAMPTVKEVLALGECWRPFRTTAAWYLWRVADRARKQSQATKTAA